jgi:hypothetical protein
MYTRECGQFSLQQGKRKEMCEVINYEQLPHKQQHVYIYLSCGEIAIYTQIVSTNTIKKNTLVYQYKV